MSSRRGYARPISGQVLLACGKPHLPSNLHARSISGQALLAFGKPHLPSNLHARSISGQVLLACGKPHLPSNLRYPGLLGGVCGVRKCRLRYLDLLAFGCVVFSVNPLTHSTR
jgi:hypothetical protein